MSFMVPRRDPLVSRKRDEPAGPGRSPATREQSGSRTTLIGVPGHVDAGQNAGHIENRVEPVQQHQSYDIDVVIARGEVRYSLYALYLLKIVRSAQRLSGVCQEEIK
jgi:hypothetical protein